MTLQTKIQPIETIYRGYRFRSRLEARWAVFFDALGIEWEYEPEGYKLSDGTWYLPDFWLPTFSGGMYAEVKPRGGDFTKAILFVKDTGFVLWECSGPPALRNYTIWKFHDGELYYTDGVPNWDQAYQENRMFWLSGLEDEELAEYASPSVLAYYMNAVTAALSARFER